MKCSFKIKSKKLGDLGKLEWQYFVQFYLLFSSLHITDLSFTVIMWQCEANHKQLLRWDRTGHTTQGKSSPSRWRQHGSSLAVSLQTTGHEIRSSDDIISHFIRHYSLGHALSHVRRFTGACLHLRKPESSFSDMVTSDTLP